MSRGRGSRPPSRDTAGPEGEGPFSLSWEALQFVASTAAVLGTLLYYFGWVRTRATLAYFGVDTGLLGFAAPDYLLRSVNAAIPPAIGAGLLILGLATLQIWLPGRIPDTPRGRRGRRIAVVALRGVAALLLAVAAAGIVAQDSIGRPLGILLPLTLPAAAALLVVARKMSPHPGSDARRGPGTGEARVWTFVVLMLGFVGLLWADALYAADVGRRMAAAMADRLARQPEVVLYSADRLAVAGTGVTVTTPGGTENKYGFRYAGLRVLIAANDRYLLLPAGWRRGVDSVFVIEKDDDVRIDVRVVP
ncbi:hypothetical protein [Actinoplanes rectilineatus]|uniref:hypothetical protein n=1 Tax=Actinoplanes rectilineatus TaxID=113571 RepID=UPI0005F283BE|nr:hypothetical protein [Actinoplanes rectilineatus]